MRLLLQRRTVLHPNGEDTNGGHSPSPYLHCSLLQQAFVAQPEHASPHPICHTDTDPVQTAATHADAVLQTLRGVAPAVEETPQGQPPEPTAVAGKVADMNGLHLDPHVQDGHIENQSEGTHSHSQGSSKLGPDQHARSRWLVEQYEGRLGAAARSVAAALGSCQQQIPGLAAYAEQLMQVAMGAEDALIGGPSITVFAASLLGRIQRPA